MRPGLLVFALLPTLGLEPDAVATGCVLCGRDRSTFIGDTGELGRNKGTLDPCCTTSSPAASITALLAARFLVELCVSVAFVV